jgi:hypothetical protein
VQKALHYKWGERHPCRSTSRVNPDEWTQRLHFEADKFRSLWETIPPLYRTDPYNFPYVRHKTDVTALVRSLTVDGKSHASIGRHRDLLMPQNGEKNRRFGVYKSLCCGEDIILPEGKDFPDCPNHPNLTTIWKSLVGDTFLRLTKPCEPPSRRTPRFSVGDKVRIVGVDANRGRLGVVVQVLESPTDFVHRYEVRFSEEVSARYFGFQLELFQAQSSRSA